MNDFVFTINDSVSCHEDVLSHCNKMVQHFEKYPKSKLILDCSLVNFIYPDYALLILCSIKYLESLGINIVGKFKYNPNSSIVTYLSKMQFFNNLDINIPNSLKNLYPHSFVKIQSYNKDNQIDVLTSILKMLRVNSKIDDNVYASLDYCFNEILDNVLNHSDKELGKGKGWVVAQYFPNLNSIRLMVCDFGIGIKKALEEVYNFEEKEALLSCIKEGVTNGKGQGHGLYATSQFIEMNKGWLSIISGENKLDLSEDSIVVNSTPYWQGTCVYMRINTNIDVDYRKFTGKYYDYKEHVFETMFENK